MAPKVYKSSLPSIPIVERSVYTHLFESSDPESNLVGQFPGSAPAFIDAVSGTTITRAELKRLTLAFGYGVRHHPRIAAKRGDTILIYSVNSLCWPVVLLGSVAAGLRCTLANSAYKARELAYQYTDTGAVLILAGEEGLPVARETLRSVGFADDQVDRNMVVLGSSLRWAGGPTVQRKPGTAGLVYMEDLLGLGTLSEEEKFDGKLAHETLYLCYSSGTTGKPKGVETTHQNVTSLVDIFKPIFPVTSGKPMILGIQPFYHIGGLINLLHFPFKHGIPVVIQHRFDPVQFCANVERYKITIVPLVPPVLVLLARHPAVDQYDMSSLEILNPGAAPLGPSLVHSVMQRLLSKRNGKGNLIVVQGYGLTETSSNTHLVPKEDHMRKLGSVGILLPNLEARIIAEEGDHDVEEGQPGELWVRGPTVMKAYLGNKTATAESITPDRWLKTGDIGKRDNEGFYYIIDRRKELIKYKGSQVAPAELESVLLTHHDIADAAVIGVHSTKEATELPRAYVVHARPDGIRREDKKMVFCAEVERWIQTQVSHQKYLRGGVVVVDVIPKSGSGKILRRELRERAKRELEGQDLADTWKTKL